MQNPMPLGLSEHWRFYDARIECLIPQRLFSPFTIHHSPFPDILPTMKRLTSLVFVIGVTLVCAVGVTAQEVAPRTLNIPDPEYPPEAQRAHRGGSVFVIVWVSKKGKVSVGESYGPLAPCSDLGDRITKLMRKAAVEAAAKATFEPGTKNGKPVEMGLELKYVFDPDKKPEKPEMKTAAPVQGGVLNGKATRLTRPNHPGKNYVAVIVEVEVLIDETGKVIAAAALSTETPFTRASVDAACSSRFTPTFLSGQARTGFGTDNLYF